MAQSPPEQTDSVSVARILGVHGTSGEFRIRTYSDVPHRFDTDQVLYCNGSPLQISSSKATRPQQMIIKFAGINSPEEGRDLVGQWLTVPQEVVAEPPEGEYFHFQLLGLRVVTDENEALGEITEVIETGSNDVYVVEGAGGQLLLPAIASVILEVNINEGVMVVHLMQGMR